VDSIDKRALFLNVEMRNWHHESSICRGRFECFSSHGVLSETKNKIKTLLVVDFDGTCSKEDTTCKIVDSAIAGSVSRMSSPIEKKKESNRRKSLYNDLLHNYVRSLESLLNRNIKQVWLKMKSKIIILLAIAKTYNFYIGS
jgi:hypothetical protein